MHVRYEVRYRTRRAQSGRWKDDTQVFTNDNESLAKAEAEYVAARLVTEVRAALQDEGMDLAEVRIVKVTEELVT